MPACERCRDVFPFFVLLDSGVTLCFDCYEARQNGLVPEVEPDDPAVDLVSMPEDPEEDSESEEGYCEWCREPCADARAVDGDSYTICPACIAAGQDFVVEGGEEEDDGDESDDDTLLGDGDDFDSGSTTTAPDSDEEMPDGWLADDEIDEDWEPYSPESLPSTIDQRARARSCSRSARR